MAPDTDDGPDLDPTGHLEALAEAVIHAREHPDDPAARAAVEKVVAVMEADLGGEGGQEPTDVWDEGDEA
jgi:hypothetical protein